MSGLPAEDLATLHGMLAADPSENKQRTARRLGAMNAHELEMAVAEGATFLSRALAKVREDDEPRPPRIDYREAFLVPPPYAEREAR